MIKIPPMRKDWFRCYHCNKKILLYDNKANCGGLFIKCKKCGYENKIEIKNGKVI
ncbi:MAG: hypothetical protein ACLR9T_02190 [Thomasclavelia sp.]|uniref:hypothetical protein n=1 Tax=Thomasclavelia sp. TaxID=3025757 RepID=UPI00399FA695